MATRLYLVPVIGTGASAQDARRPKYFADGTVTPLGGSISMMDYGFEPWMLVAADVSTADHTLVAGQADTSVLPADLTTLLTAGQVTAVQTQLEIMNIPAGWVNTSLTWIQVVRIVRGMFMFVQRFTAIHQGRIFLGGVTLSTTLSQLSATVRTELATAAQSLGLDTTAIVGTTTLRAAWKILADQLVPRPVILGPIAI